jgi:hypothetical protein
MERVNGRKHLQIPMTKIVSTNLMGTMKWTKNTALVLSSGSLAISILETTTMMNEMATGQCSGQMEVNLKDIGSEEFKRVLES